MKLQIPAQLIVLSLWLLENKYSGTSPHSAQDRGRQSLKGQRGKTLRMSTSLSPSDVRRGGNKRVSPAGRGRSRSASRSPARQREVVEAVIEQWHGGLEASLPLSTLREAQEVRTAYEQVLDG